MKSTRLKTFRHCTTLGKAGPFVAWSRDCLCNQTRLLVSNAFLHLTCRLPFSFQRTPFLVHFSIFFDCRAISLRNLGRNPKSLISLRLQVSKLINMKRSASLDGVLEGSSSKRNKNAVREPTVSTLRWNMMYSMSKLIRLEDITQVPSSFAHGHTCRAQD